MPSGLSPLEIVCCSIGALFSVVCLAGAFALAYNNNHGSRGQIDMTDTNIEQDTTE